MIKCVASCCNQESPAGFAHEVVGLTVVKLGTEGFWVLPSSAEVGL